MRNWLLRARFSGPACAIELPPIGFSLREEDGVFRVAVGFTIHGLAGKGCAIRRGPVDDCAVGPDYIVAYLRFWRFYFNLMWKCKEESS